MRSPKSKARDFLSCGENMSEYSKSKFLGNFPGKLNLKSAGPRGLNMAHDRQLKQGHSDSEREAGARPCPVGPHKKH